jgi:hypothetical protein
MTCVACSSAIENGLKSEFKDRGLVHNEKEGYSISVILLVHKLKISFNKSASIRFDIDKDKIISEVEDLGFGAELLNTYEFDANRSLDSSRLFDSARSIPVDLENARPP